MKAAIRPPNIDNKSNTPSSSDNANPVANMTIAGNVFVPGIGMIIKIAISEMVRPEVQVRTLPPKIFSRGFTKISE